MCLFHPTRFAFLNSTYLFAKKKIKKNNVLFIRLFTVFVLSVHTKKHTLFQTLYEFQHFIQYDKTMSVIENYIY